MEKPIGILGGTFDPVHHGHLRLALECLEAAALTEVALVPLHTPPHRRPPVASPEQRREMLRLAVEEVRGLALEDCELQRGGVSYTVDTLAELRARYGGRPLCLIMGRDAFARLDTWHQWPLLLQHAHIIVAQRPGNQAGIENPEIAAVHAQAAVRDHRELRTSPSGRILDISIPMLDISATRLRQLRADGRSIRFLLPPAVLAFIEANHLYT
ncbi:MAG: nicotinate-nucleotide adenylyltransferase [Gammaproteobacteria bacterium]|jgi:nicotinate-nucleotide adenylyltransferase